MSRSSPPAKTDTKRNEILQSGLKRKSKAQPERENSALEARSERRPEIKGWTALKWA